MLPLNPSNNNFHIDFGYLGNKLDKNKLVEMKFQRCWNSFYVLNAMTLNFGKKLLVASLWKIYFRINLLKLTFQLYSLQNQTY